MKKINVITLGCSKNTVDSEHLMAQLAASGYRIAADSDLKSVELLQQQPCWEFTFAFHGSGPQELLIADVRRGIPHYSSAGRCRSV